MENVYGCGELDYTSEPISFQDFFNDASLLHHPFVHGPITHSSRSKTEKERADVNRERLMELMDSTLTDTEFADLESICSAENFKVGRTMVPIDFDSLYKKSLPEQLEIPKDSNLETHRKLKNRAKINEKFLKFNKCVSLEKKDPCESSSALISLNEIDLIPGNELVVVVRMYAPFQHEVGKRTHRVAVGCQEMVLLGSSSLADMRDKFSCSSDMVICKDFSATPQCRTTRLAKEKYKSGMMYIGNKFYNDMRHASNVEYSEVILAWAEERNLNLGMKAKMEDTRIIDLTVKLGYPYLYQHDGNCEHLFCFSDVRLLHQSDPLKSDQYPFIRSIGKHNSRYCMLCGHYIAKWITVGNRRVPHDPCFFCQACFSSYNYINNKKIGDFKAYPICDATPI